jgi:2-methylisocitrate lyase-like PEP mutase family enzyme
MKKTTALRRLIERKKILVAPGCYNAITARIVEKAGFEAAYLSGYATSVSLLGMPDVGLATMSEMHTTARYVANAVQIPVIADSDTGYGNAINVMRTVREYIQTGVAAIHIEDQITPKRCGHVAGKILVPLEEAAGKYRAADAARKEMDPDFVIIARTDARGALGGSLEEAIFRANAYTKAGADVLFVEAPTSVEELRKIVREVKAPILYNVAGISPHLPVRELEEIGVSLVIYPTASLRASSKAVWDYMQALKTRGTQAEIDFKKQLKGHPLEDFHAFAGFPEIRKMEEKFLPPADFVRKYESTLGYKPGE